MEDRLYEYGGEAFGVRLSMSELKAAWESLTPMEFPGVDSGKLEQLAAWAGLSRDELLAATNIMDIYEPAIEKLARITPGINNPDGPCGVRHWRHAGQILADKMPPQQWALASRLHEKIGRFVAFDHLIGDGNPFPDPITDDQTIAAAGRKVARWFRERGVPLVVSSDTVEKRMWMEQKK